MPPRNISQLSFNINGLNMEYVTEFNFLGLILDSNLNWKAHTNFISVKIACKVLCIISEVPQYSLPIVCDIVQYMLYMYSKSMQK